ncbi:MAG: hypothetical protein ABI771_12425 [Betaproteobacteria bacterium]
MRYPLFLGGHWGKKGLAEDNEFAPRGETFTQPSLPRSTIRFWYFLPLRTLCDFAVKTVEDGAQLASLRISSDSAELAINP